MTAQTMTLLSEGLDQLGLAGHAGETNLRAYLTELDRWSGRLGLVHATGSKLIVRHILDSLAGLETIRPLVAGGGKTLVDIGSGGGLPGIPIACYLQDVRIRLVERSERKCGFLRGAVLAAGLRNVETISADYTSLETTSDLIVFRALQPLSAALVGRMIGLLVPGGRLCAYKGRRERIQEELDSLGQLPASWDIRVEPIAVPFLDEERNLVVITYSS